MTDWTLILSGGPRHGDRITTPEILPFLKFTAGGADGTTVDHYYAPTESDPATLTATYGWLSDGHGPDSALAMIWEEGYDAGKADLRDKNLERAVRNPYRRRK